MKLRNFYINCEIDGRKSRLTGGPQAKDGGFSLTIYQRSNCEKIKSLNVSGTVRAKGELVLDILVHDAFLPIAFNHKRVLTKR